ncbi:MAG: DUF1194 domain-containing protein [Paracoccaceae bacterium]
MRPILPAFLLVLWAGQAQACALALVLALDVSGSIDAGEFDLQTGGLADALEDEQVVAAVEALEGGMIATVTHWSGASRQRQMIGWHRLSDGPSLARLGAAVREAGRAWRNFSTAIGEAVEHAVAVGQDAPEVCERRVIDVSGDGVSNEGRRPEGASAAAAAAGWTVNALVIRGAVPDPVRQYTREVIAGPGAFVEVAEGFEDYARAIRRKLLREIDPWLFVSERARSGPGTPAGSSARR